MLLPEMMVGGYGDDEGGEREGGTGEAGARHFTCGEGASGKPAREQRTPDHCGRMWRW